MTTSPPIPVTLLPCPFCGGEVKQILMSIVCKTCSATTAFMICSITTHAHRLWNTRANPTPDLLPPSWETLARNIREIIAAEAAKGGSVFKAVDAVMRELTSTGNPTPDSSLVEKLEAIRCKKDCSSKAYSFGAHLGGNRVLDKCIAIVRQHYGSGAGSSPSGAVTENSVCTPAPANSRDCVKCGLTTRGGLHVCPSEIPVVDKLDELIELVMEDTIFISCGTPEGNSKDPNPRIEIMKMEIANALKPVMGGVSVSLVEALEALRLHPEDGTPRAYVAINEVLEIVRRLVPLSVDIQSMRAGWEKRKEQLIALANLADAYEAGFRDAAGVPYVN